jgi:hypothetical protein
MNGIFSNSRNRLILASAAVVVVIAAAGGGYYFLSGPGTAAKHGGQSVSLAEIGICKAVVARARDYGVLPPDAAKVGERTTDEKNPDRVTCSAQATDGTFKLTADVHCDDANKDSCLQLQKVTNDSGTALYDTHEI